MATRKLIRNKIKRNATNQALFPLLHIYTRTHIYMTVKIHARFYSILFNFISFFELNKDFFVDKQTNTNAHIHTFAAFFHFGEKSQKPYFGGRILEWFFKKGEEEEKC